MMEEDVFENGSESRKYREIIPLEEWLFVVNSHINSLIMLEAKYGVLSTKTIDEHKAERLAEQILSVKSEIDLYKGMREFGLIEKDMAIYFLDSNGSPAWARVTPDAKAKVYKKLNLYSL